MKNGNRLLVLLLITPFILAVAIFIRRSAHPPGQRPTVGELRSGNLIKDWAAADFTPIEMDKNLSQKVTQIELRNEHLLNQRQRLQLEETIQNYVMAYNVGSFDSFRRFRTPTAHFKLVPSASDYLKQDLLNSGMNVPADEESLFKAYWDRYISNKWEHFWTGIALTNCFVDVETTQTNMPPLRDYIFEHQNVGMASVGPLVIFDITPELLLRKDGAVLYATTSLLLKNNDVTCPVYCRFYWVEEYSKWLPIEQAAAYSGPRKKTLIF